MLISFLGRNVTDSALLVRIFHIRPRNDDFFFKNNIFFFNFYKKELNMAMAVARKMRYAADLGNTLIARLDMDIPGP